MSITPAQCRAARGLIDFDQANLASSANLSRNTIVDFEKGKRVPNVNNLAAIRAALEFGGRDFRRRKWRRPGRQAAQGRRERQGRVYPA